MKENTEKKLNVRIERYQDLLEILDDRRKVWRLASIVLVTGIALFLGIALLVLQLKKSFTYSDITTNAFGATTIADEQKRVSYFLFNTAELWANSGIPVEKGDVISIYASGAAHTAIHHLYQASKDNQELSQRYFDSNGGWQNDDNPRDKLRSKYRIFPEMPQSALIMQVSKEYPYNENKFAFLPDSASQDQFYYIGGKRENIHILQDGMLFFAINDIVLSKATITKMEMENLFLMRFYKKEKHIAKIGSDMFPQLNKLAGGKITFDSVDNTIHQLQFKNEEDVKVVYDGLKELIKQHFKTDTLKAEYMRYLKDKENFSFGPYYESSDPLLTEMDYYYNNKYKQAWFDDNVGSFLIVIEKDNSNLQTHGK